MEQEITPRAVSVSAHPRDLSVYLDDGRTLMIPYAWYPSLSKASPEQRNGVYIIGSGTGLHWPDIDEDLSVNGIMRELEERGVLVRVPEPREWLRILGILTNEESQIILQEWFGYCLTDDTSMQKALLLVGDVGAEKDLVTDTLKSMLKLNQNMSLSSLPWDDIKFSRLEGAFSLKGIEGKSVVFLTGPTGHMDVHETSVGRMVSVTGEEVVTVESKGMPAVMKKIGTRFVIDTPSEKKSLRTLRKYEDAIERRLVTVRLDCSGELLDKESLLHMRKALEEELPQILAWSRRGYERLKKAGKFTKLKNGSSRGTA